MSIKLFSVDDASEQDHLGHQLEEYCSKLPVPVHVFRTGKRSGLIRARLLDTKHVKGSVIPFYGLYLYLELIRQFVEKFSFSKTITKYTN